MVIPRQWREGWMWGRFEGPAWGRIKEKAMLTRSKVYFDWAQSRQDHFGHDETLDNGAQLDIRARVAAHGDTQLFVGAYGADGRMLMEEYHPVMDNMTAQQAISWGTERAKSMASAVKA